MAGLVETPELRLRRSSVHRHHDMKRLEDGEDLNDALLDFFVKLGQAVIPCGGLEGGFPSVAFLGSLFYDVLRKGGAADGRAGHANVAKWGRKRLGEGGLFFDGIGALAVPVNETLRDCNGRAAPKEKHWWLALVLNPRGGGRPKGEEQTSIICLDSVVRSEVRFHPPARAVHRSSNSYPLEVTSLYRQGYGAFVRFRATGDGSLGALPDPDGSRLCVDGRDFGRPNANLTVDQRGSHGVGGKIEGQLEFALDSMAMVCCEHTLEFGEMGLYSPPIRLSMKRHPSDFQKDVARFLSGYISREWETGAAKDGANGRETPAYDAARIESSLCLPDVPQQETANDCGFFILAQILLLLQLSPEGLRTLAAAPVDLVMQLPWPSQKDVTRRKVKLREALEALFQAADDVADNDVDALLKQSPELRAQVQAALWDGPQFAEALRRVSAAAAPQKDYTLADLGQMSTKALRSLCVQRGLLPPGMVERADLLKALVPTVVQRASPPPAHGGAASPRASPAAAAAAAGGASAGRAQAGSGEPEARRAGAAEQHLGAMTFTAEDLETMPIKTLRGLCVQHRVLPANSLERADFVNALLPLVTDAPPRPAAAEPGRAPEKRPQAGGGEPEAKRVCAAEQHLGAMSFASEDLETLPLKTLRGLCVQHRVLPANALERADFVRALLPLATDAPPGAAAAAAAAAVEGAPAAGVDAAPAGPPAAAAPAAAAAPPARAETTEERKARWAKAVGAHLAGMRFEAADLEVMPLKILRALCVQHKVLPACAVERADFVGALAPLVGDGAALRAAAASAPANGGAREEPKKEPPRRDFSRFLGAAKPNFTAADLEDMPEPTLRTLCIQHGVLPLGTAGRPDLLDALRKVALPPRA